MKRLSILAAAFLSPALAIAQSDLPPLEPLTCLLNPYRVSEIGSDRASIVRNVPVKRAQFVREGDVLVQLDDTFLQNEKTVAQISFDSLTNRLERSSRLTSGNLISRDEIEQIRTELAVATAELERAELEIQRAN